MEISSNTTCPSGGQPILLSSPTCLDGFYCPSRGEEQYQAEYCTPSAECLLTRLQSSNNICATPQSPREPMICAPGFYCPRDGAQQIECTQGHFCPLGTVAPFKCTALSICKGGSSHQTPLLGLILCVLLGVLVVFAIWAVSPPDTASRLKPNKCLHLLPRFIQRHACHRDEDGNDTATPPGDYEDYDYISERATNLCPLRLSFTDIHLRPRGCQRDILSDLHGTIESGSVLGIIGASGSGKSSFVTTLAGRNRPTQGWISINGRRSQSKDLRTLIGYIPQHELLLPDLTVRENILYSARTLLGGSQTDPQIHRYVDSLLSSLGLTTIRNAPVGDLLKRDGGRGISGGEYKRVSIAIALAGAPRVLVLDEPTSGLDATAAHSLVRLLHALARKRRIMVVCVVHQPRVEIFRLLGELLVLHEGRQVYLGKAASAQAFFESWGWRFESGANPADVMLDNLMEGLHRQNSSSGKAQTLDRFTGEVSVSDDEQLSKLLQSIRQRRAPWLRQLWLVFLRSMRQQSRQRTGLVLEVVSSAVIGLMIGLSAFESRGRFFQGIYHAPFDVLSSAVEYRLVSEQALLCCLAIACAAGPPGVRTFGEEKLTFHREWQSGHSRTAYFIGKNLATSVRMLLASLHFTAFYLLLAAPMISFAMQLALSFLYFYCIYGLGFLVAAVTHREDGPLLCMLLCLIISALSGCAPHLATVRSWHLAWFWYAWPATWFSEAFYHANTSPLGYLYDIQAAARYTGYTMGRTGMDVGFLILIGTAYRALAYLLFVLWGWK